MDFEFDKEIDAILRKARGDDAAALSGAHLDADEIAAFAENSLPQPARQRYTAHFADCARCRKILSNAFVFNTEADAEAASSVVSVESVETSVPWYRKLFAFPQAAYAMGAMVLLFSGFFGYLILQNLTGRNAEVSYSANTATNPAAPAAERPAAMSNSNSASMNATTTTANVAPGNVSTQSANTSSSSANTTRLSTTNTTTAATPPQDTIAQENAPVTEVQPMATPAPKPQVKDEADDDSMAKISPATPTNANAARQRSERDKEDQDYSVDGSSSGATPDQKKKTARVPSPSRKNEEGAGATRSVGGKIFNNVGGIWFDTAVGKQKQKTVRRGTSEYQKLDAGLRSIADQLGGTVVILWGGRAYRIQ